MLIVKVSVNGREIDEINIQNVGPVEVFPQDWNIELDWECTKNVYWYRIRKPKGFEDHKFIHKRDYGYKPLLVAVLEFLEEQEAKANDKN